jgi:hypothetical protein
VGNQLFKRGQKYHLKIDFDILTFLVLPLIESLKNGERKLNPKMYIGKKENVGVLELLPEFFGMVLVLRFIILG